MSKPCNLDELRVVMTEAFLENRRLVDARGTPLVPVEASDPAFQLIGGGPAMRSLAAVIDQVAASSAPVLIVGETGSGKELVARAVHARGPRRRGRFVAVNTAAVPEALLQADHFGHPRGAVPGALQARKGLLVEADQGTLLLDEIGDMPIALQAKLLRVIQFGEVRPVGSDRTQRVDVRILASTHRDLPAFVREGRIREDLYFRLNVLPVLVPPLRERREDIPALAAHLFAEACRRAPGAPARAMDPGVLRALSQAEWPGNVRELANVIERAVVFGRVDALAPAAPPPAREAGAPLAPPGPWPLPGETPVAAAAPQSRVHGVGPRGDGRKQGAGGPDAGHRPLHALPLAARSHPRRAAVRARRSACLRRRERSPRPASLPPTCPRSQASRPNAWTPGPSVPRWTPSDSGPFSTTTPPLTRRSRTA